MKRRHARIAAASQLRCVAEVPVDGSALPLPEGWPAADHEEGDPAVAAAKVASGLYELADEVEVSHGDGASVVS